MAQVCASAPTWPAVLVIRSLRTHEEVLAMVRFLRFYGVTNPIFVKVEDLDPESFPAASLERRILATLERVSAQGGGASGPSEPGAEPWSRFAGPPCFGLGFSGAPGFGCAPVLELR